MENISEWPESMLKIGTESSLEATQHCPDAAHIYLAAAQQSEDQQFKMQCLPCPWARLHILSDTKGTSYITIPLAITVKKQTLHL